MGKKKMKGFKKLFCSFIQRHGACSLRKGFSQVWFRGSTLYCLGETVCEPKEIIIYTIDVNVQNTLFQELCSLQL